MKKKYVTVVFDRKKRLATTGEGKVELHIYLGRSQRKYVTLKTCNAISWRRYQKSDELKSEVLLYEQVIELMLKKGEDLTLANLNHHLGIDDRKRENDIKRRFLKSSTGFIDFMRDRMHKEKLTIGSMKRKRVTIEGYEKIWQALPFCRPHTSKHQSL